MTLMVFVLTLDVSLILTFILFGQSFVFVAMHWNFLWYVWWNRSTQGKIYKSIVTSREWHHDTEEAFGKAMFRNLRRIQAYKKKKKFLFAWLENEENINFWWKIFRSQKIFGQLWPWLNQESFSLSITQIEQID